MRQTKLCFFMMSSSNRSWFNFVVRDRGVLFEAACFGLIVPTGLVFKENSGLEEARRYLTV